MKLEEIAKELLNASEYINIASSSTSGEPWNTPATGVYDKELNFYWSSWKEANHSINVRENPRVFITLYDSTRKRGDNHRKCLYIKAKAFEATEASDIEKAMSLLYAEHSTDRETSMFLGEAQRRIYKAVPIQIWLNDKSEREVTNETIKMRIEVSLDKLKAIL